MSTTAVRRTATLEGQGGNTLTTTQVSAVQPTLQPQATIITGPGAGQRASKILFCRTDAAWRNAAIALIIVLVVGILFELLFGSNNCLDSTELFTIGGVGLLVGFIVYLITRFSQELSCPTS
jgi:hypothetical protein